MSPVKNILILGGYGRAGLEIAKLLLKYSHHNICLAGRDPIRAFRAASELNSRCFQERVTGIEVNAVLKSQLVRLFEKADLVISAIPSTFAAKKAAQAALESGIDFMDLGTGSMEPDALYQLEDKVREAGLTFITEARFQYGAPSAMARYIAGQLDLMDRLTMDVGNDAAPGKGPFKRFGGGRKGRLKSPQESSWVSVSGTGVSGDRGMKLMLTVGHEDASLAAAMAAFPCVMGLVEGFASRPGIHPMGNVLDPESYLEYLWDLGMTVHLQKWPDPMPAKALPEGMQPVQLRELPVF